MDAAKKKAIFGYAKVLAAALATTVTLGGNAAAATVTMKFEGIAPPGLFVFGVTPYQEAGFTLTNSLGGDSLTDGLFDSECLVNDNGTDFFGWCAEGVCESLVISLTRSGGASFNFISFDTAVLEAGIGSNVIDVIGHLQGGGTMSTTITQTDVWTTYQLDYAGVTKVDFAFGPGHADAPNHAFDNLTMSVPEPSSLALLSIGFVGLCSRRRYRGAKSRMSTIVTEQRRNDRS